MLPLVSRLLGNRYHRIPAGHAHLVQSTERVGNIIAEAAGGSKISNGVAIVSGLSRSTVPCQRFVCDGIPNPNQNRRVVRISLCLIELLLRHSGCRRFVS